MFLFEGCADTVDAGIAVQAEGAGVVGDGVPVRIDQNRGSGEFAELSDDGFRFRGEDELDTLLEQGFDGAKPSGNILQESVIVPNTSDERADLLDVLGHGHFGECCDFVDARANAGGGDSMSQEIGVGGAKLGFGGREFENVLSQALEKEADVGDVGRGVGIERYDVVEVGGYAVQVLDDLVGNLNEANRSRRCYLEA